MPMYFHSHIVGNVESISGWPSQQKQKVQHASTCYSRQPTSCKLANGASDGDPVRASINDKHSWNKNEGKATDYNQGVIVTSSST